jgi:Fuc2NAc and GlcNAc transferase
VLIFEFILLAAMIASMVLTGLLRRYALAYRVMDVPNARSSHQLPTPRGGGLAIVIVFLGGLVFFSQAGLLAKESMWAFMSAGAWIAVVGFLDDHGHIPARWRLLMHFIGAAGGLFWLGGMPAIVVFGHARDLGWIGHILGVIYLVWLLNLYNFMDGIDGIAGIEATTVCLGGILLYLSVPGSGGQRWQLALLAMTVAGFLIWNFPPAKIFMGDAGSGFLGLMMGLFSLQAAGMAPQLFWGWLILLGVFIVDATWTLLLRLWRGEKVYEAHCSHAYQYAARRYGAHKPVSLAVGFINLCWLMPIAWWVSIEGVAGLWGLVLAYSPLWLLAIYFRAGRGDAA